MNSDQEVTTNNSGSGTGQRFDNLLRSDERVDTVCSPERVNAVCSRLETIATWAGLLCPFGAEARKKVRHMLRTFSDVEVYHAWTEALACGTPTNIVGFFCEIGEDMMECAQAGRSCVWIAP